MSGSDGRSLSAGLSRPAIPWPIGTVPIVEPDQRPYGSTMPGLSPGSSEPVVAPNPKRSIHDASSGPPRCCAMVIVPTFEDCARIWRTVIRAVPRVCASPIVRSATWILGASRNDVVGETMLSSSAAATVTILKVEPGSYRSVTARFLRASAWAVP